MNPARFGANGSKRPVFCLACGRVLERSTVNTALKAAAVALGLDPADHATHSLRAGGATALYAIGWPPSKIQRRGRWLSDCWFLEGGSYLLPLAQASGRYERPSGRKH